MAGARDADAWDLVDLHLSSGSGTASTATVSLKHRTGRVVKYAAVVSGPVEAIFRAIGRASETTLDLIDFQVKGLTSGLNGVGEVTVEIEELGQRHRGRATGSDIMQASAEAFLRVVNRVLATRESHKELVDVFGQ
jgi:2-isopropylmalate synthase